MDDNAHCNGENPVLHVLVVGFHHKKGCQVEYSFPPLVPGSADESECPPGWKYLPTLALPDGSHNYDEDTVFFHLPSLTDPDKSVFGISCFRQIPVEKLKNRTADITRGTVQKSVCVLSRVPLYGQIQVKMALITHAYFEEGDFTKVSLLSETYHHLNACISQHIAGDDYDSTASQLFVGLSGRDLILHWRHKALLLFKLLLLERKVVFYKSPVRPLCSTILSLLSLHPGMIETGLYQSACIQPSRPMSPVPQFDEVRAKQHQQENSCREKETNRLVKDENDKDEQKTRDAEGRLKGATEEEEEAKKDERRGGDEENCVERLSYDLMKKEGDEQRRKGVDEGERAVKEEENACGKGMDKQVQDDSQTDIEQQNRVQESNADATENGCSKFDKEDSNCYHDSEQIKKNGYIDGLITNETKREERIDVIRNKGRGGMVMNRNVKTERPISSGRMETSLEMAREAISDDNVGGGGVVTFQSRRRGSNDVITADDDYDDDDGEQVTIASLPRDVSVETLGDVTAQNNIAAIAPIDALACGLPLAIFTEGYLCMPYLSLPYLDLLSDQNVRGYVVGATNVLFKQKKRLADVLVEVDGARIEVTAGGIGGVVGGGAVQDGAGAMASAAAAVELRRQLHLSTEDLRFADYLVRHVAPPVTGGGATVATTSCATTEAPNVVDVFVDGVGWEGGDEWLRNQFRVYMLCLLRTSLLPEGSRELDQFNAAFIAAWRRTRSYELWLQQLTGDTSIWNLHPGHPFAGGQLSVADMKLRITHTMQNTEGGRKLNQAMVSTGRAVATTGRAVGGAISQAKGALSSWWSNLTTAQSPTEGGPPPLSLPGGQKGPATENGEHSQKSADSEDSSRAKVEDTALASSSVFEV